MVFDPLAREHDAAVADHVFEQGKLLGRERDRAPAARDMVRGGIDREIGDGEDIRGAAAALARDDAQPGQQLVERKRFDKIIIRPSVKPAHTVGHAVFRREEDDRRLAAALAHLRQERKAVHARHHHVEHDGVILRALQVVQRLHAVKAGIDAIALGSECFGEDAVEVLFIFHDQNTHTRPSLLSV